MSRTALSVVTDPTDTSPLSGGGMFTATNAESRRVVPEDVNGRPVMKVVYVVLESQYQSSMTASRNPTSVLVTNFALAQQR